MIVAALLFVGCHDEGKKGGCKPPPPSNVEKVPDTPWTFGLLAATVVALGVIHRIRDYNETA
jgi:hypothetical protein